MAPAQPLMDFDSDIKPIFSTRHRPDEEDTSSLENLDGQVLKCMENCGETMFAMEPYLDKQTEESKGFGDVEVDIIEGSHTNDIRVANAEDRNATEYSSSFGNTVSGNENCSEFSEAEVESQLYGDNDLAAFDPFGIMFQARKKKLTSHWRNFVRPLMWRCKWAELRIKEIEARASKYSKELAAYDQRKIPGLDQFLLEDFGSKSLPFTSQNYRKKAMKRRKRKRVEDTTDMLSYISHHNLFAYLDNKRSDPDATSAADDFSNPVCTDQYINGTDEFGANNEWSLLEFRDDDNSLEHVLWKIEMVHSRAHKLKSQIDMVMSKNASKFSSSENLSLLVPDDAQTSSRHSPAFSAGNGDAISVGAIYSPSQHISECDIGDLVMPESGISSCREAIPVPDVIESTGGLLLGADVTLHQPQIGDSCEDTMDNVVIHNKTAEAEKQALKSTSNKPMLARHEEAEKNCKQGESIVKPDSVGGVGVSAEHSNLTSSLASEFHVPTIKRKRGERKGGSGWRRRSGSGEPDSQ